MSFSIQRRYEPKMFKLGELPAAIKAIFSEIGIDPREVRLSLYRRIGEVMENVEDISLEDPRPIMDFEQISHLQASYRLKESHGFSLYFSINREDDCLKVYVNCAEAEHLHRFMELIEDRFGLVRQKTADNEEKDYGKALKNLEQRIASIEEALRKPSQCLRCFLAMRFTAEAKAIMHELERFLSLIGIEVITGLAYEPRSIQEKIRSRLSSEVDFVIYLVCGGGESTWTRDEIIYAFGKGVPIVPLVEEGSSLANGILGGHEYISFAPGHIGDAFTPLLEAIRFMELKRSSGQASNSRDDRVDNVKEASQSKQQA